MVVAARLNPLRPLMAGRAHAEQRMLDSCRITEDSEPVWDEATGTYVPVAVTVYEGRCEVRLRESLPAEQVQAGQFATVVQYTLKIPFGGTEQVREHQTVTITACRLDPALVGAVYRVAAFTRASMQTARRLPLEEVRPR